MSPRVLRAKTGCQTCKRRHKKCGEEQPSCANCVRLSLVCQWTPPIAEAKTELSALDDRRLIVAPALLTYQSGLIANGWQSFHSQSQFDLAIRCPDLIKQLPPPQLVSVDTMESSASALNVLVLSEPTIRASAAALTASLTIDEVSVSTEHYLASVAGFRRLLQNDVGRENIHIKILVAFFLGLTEALGLADIKTSAIHFRAAVVFYSNHATSSTTIPGPIGDFIVRMVKSTILLVSMSSIYEPNQFELRHSIDLLRLCDYHIRLSNTQSPNQSMTTIFDEMTTLYFYLLQVAYLSRQTPNNASTLKKAQELTRTVVCWERQLIGGQFVDEPSSQPAKYGIPIIKALTGSLLIHLVKIMSPLACSSHPEVKRHVSERFDFMMTYTSDSSFTLDAVRRGQVEYRPFDIYPALIFICAIDSINQFEKLVSQMYRPNGQKNDHKSLIVAALIKTIRERKRRNQAHDACTCMYQSHSVDSAVVMHDGMDFLLHPAGILGALGSS